MIFTEIFLAGVFLVLPERHEDERGFFARSWCQKEFTANGMNGRLVQCNISYNRRRGTLRGMHLQVPPNEEAKLVRCTMGAIYDVIIDLRKGSPTVGRHFGVNLTADNRQMIYIPEGFAHGFLTLDNQTEVFYQMSEFYAPESARGVRWNDPAFGIRWPEEVNVISRRDQTYPDFDPERPYGS
jgi:dTDP-4-dehydrorhamnose 3,5-epimerase